MNQDAPLVSDLGHCEPDWFAARDIARATGFDKKTVRRRARLENWPTRVDGNRELYQPPARIAEMVIAAPVAEREALAVEVRFADLVGKDPQIGIVLKREKAVNLLRENLHLGKEVALEMVAATMRAKYADFDCSSRSLRRWLDRYEAHGIDGLVEQKRGRVGRKAFVNDLDHSTILKYTAAAIEHGNARKGDGKPQTNVARAYRQMVADPTIQGRARTWLHGASASKSNVPESVLRALQPSPLTATLIQRGPKAAKLDGAFTESHYDDVKAGVAFTADDMTANVYVWCEWPNEEGFILIRPQILAAMDIGSMSWLCLRAVMRPKGQYAGDDVWGLVGDVFDDYGQFKIAVFEGGMWQQQRIVGHICDDETRFGGLRSLGCKVIHTRSPRGKIIETAFNVLQHAADSVRGFCGRNEKVDCPESVKQQLAEVRAGKAHPRQYFLHISEYRTHLEAVMNLLNHERNDGKICQGLCPKDKWDQDNEGVERLPFPEKSKWMYRASYRVNQVTRNGVRISVGTGAHQSHYTYSHEALVPHRGRRVAIFWNDYDPNTDAVIYTIKNGRPQDLICVAPRVQSLSRFGAKPEEIRAESTRKSNLANVARVERASLAPYLQRSWRTATASPKAAEVGDTIAQARSTGEERERASATTSNNARKFRSILKRRVADENLGAESLAVSADDRRTGGSDSENAGRGCEAPSDSLHQTGDNTFTYNLK